MIAQFQFEFLLYPGLSAHVRASFAESSRLCEPISSFVAYTDAGYYNERLPGHVLMRVLLSLCECSLERLNIGCLWLNPTHALDELSARVHLNRGGPHHRRLLGKLNLRVNVHLENLNRPLAKLLLDETLEHGRERAAGAACGRDKLDDRHALNATNPLRAHHLL